MLTIIGIIFLILILFGGHSGKSNYDYEEDEIDEELFYMDMMDHHK